eukprot:6215040-Amphidinium_carterae.1
MNESKKEKQLKTKRCPFPSMRALFGCVEATGWLLFMGRRRNAQVRLPHVGLKPYWKENGPNSNGFCCSSIKMLPHTCCLCEGIPALKTRQLTVVAVVVQGNAAHGGSYVSSNS